MKYNGESPNSENNLKEDEKSPIFPKTLSIYVS
jgi:hypothetical protein